MVEQIFSSGAIFRSVWEIVSDALTNPNWLKEFEKEFQENLREREYIR